MNINFYDLIGVFREKYPFRFAKKGGKNKRNSGNNLHENQIK